MSDSFVKKLPLNKILYEALSDCRNDGKNNLIFSTVAYVVGAMALFSWKSLAFWPVLLLMYVLWGAHFRYYLQKRPYFDCKMLFDSLVPSTKIVLLSVLIVSILILLPLLPLFMNLSPEFKVAYAKLLQGNFQEQQIFVAFTDIFFLVISPVVAYRPFLAWISSLVGRSGSLRFAWSRTRGNYWEFLLIAILTNLTIMFIRWVVFELGGNDYITLLFAAPMVIYFNVVSAKAYEFFFLDKE